VAFEVAVWGSNTSLYSLCNVTPDPMTVIRLFVFVDQPVEDPALRASGLAPGSCRQRQATRWSSASCQTETPGSPVVASWWSAKLLLWCHRPPGRAA